jgi:hypothetical protein
MQRGRALLLHQALLPPVRSRATASLLDRRVVCAVWCANGVVGDEPRPKV